MLTTILVAALLLMGGGIALFGLFANVAASVNRDLFAKEAQTNIALVAITIGTGLVAVAVVWGIVAQAF